MEIIGKAFGMSILKIKGTFMHGRDVNHSEEEFGGRIFRRRRIVLSFVGFIGDGVSGREGNEAFDRRSGRYIERISGLGESEEDFKDFRNSHLSYFLSGQRHGYHLLAFREIVGIEPGDRAGNEA